jgi:peptidoglycan/xylan/chitin deacetylase (PgdA/CDA1 family)
MRLQEELAARPGTDATSVCGDLSGKARLLAMAWDVLHCERGVMPFPDIGTTGPLAFARIACQSSAVARGLGTGVQVRCRRGRFSGVSTLSVGAATVRDGLRIHVMDGGRRILQARTDSSLEAVIDPVFRAAAWCASARGGRLVVLFYHRVLAAPDPMLPTEPDARIFDAQMRALGGMFNVLPMDEAIARLTEGRLPPRAACITFDDGYRDNLQIAAPILARHGMTATFFVASGFLDGGRMFNDTVRESVRRLPTGEHDLSWLNLGRRQVDDSASRMSLFMDAVAAIKYLDPDARDAAGDRLAALADAPLPDDLMMTSDEVRALQRSGMEVGGHTLTHPILSRIGDDEARRQIDGNRAVLASLLERPPRFFAYPNGVPQRDYAARHVAMARDAGYQAAVSTARGTCTHDSDLFQLPRFAPWHSRATDYRLSLLKSLAKRTSETRA